MINSDPVNIDVDSGDKNTFVVAESIYALPGRHFPIRTTTHFCSTRCQLASSPVTFNTRATGKGNMQVLQTLGRSTNNNNLTGAASLMQGPMIHPPSNVELIVVRGV